MPTPSRLAALLALASIAHCFTSTEENVRGDRPGGAPPPASGGPGHDDSESSLDSLVLRTAALRTAVERARLDVEALVEGSGACAGNTPAARRDTDAWGSGHERVGAEGKGVEVAAEADTLKDGAPAYATDALGLRALQPLDGEILHRNMAVYRFEAFLPPQGDVAFTVTLDGRSIQQESLCSWACPQDRGAQEARSGSAHEGCTCRCSGSCDCALCRRTSYSEVVRLLPPRGLLSPGIHTLIIQLNAPQTAERVGRGIHESGAAALDAGAGVNEVRLSVQSHFKVVETWTSAFPALTESAQQVWEGWRGITAPRFPMAGLQYSMPPYQAAGTGALWPGVSIHRPLPGEVFPVEEGVTLDLEVFDFDVSPDGHRRADGSLDVAIALQYTNAQCAEFAGCPVSTRLSMANLTRLLASRGASGSTRLECADAGDCSRLTAAGLRCGGCVVWRKHESPERRLVAYTHFMYQPYEDILYMIILYYQMIGIFQYMFKMYY